MIDGSCVHKKGNAKVSGQHFSRKRSLLTPSEDDFIQSFLNGSNRERKKKQMNFFFLTSFECADKLSWTVFITSLKTCNAVTCPMLDRKV